MKINPVSNPNILRSYQANRVVQVQTSVQSARDEVTFSKEALSFSKVMAEVESRSVEERAHIANIKNAVRKGEYKIDSDKVADKILESVFGR